ncbi:MAG: hypothetical protein O3B72_04185, partial [Proteobacteria bacterium]|nr:hypothetical protein [Pseudomonadota bacterium]
AEVVSKIQRPEILAVIERKMYQPGFKQVGAIRRRLQVAQGFDHAGPSQKAIILTDSGGSPAGGYEGIIRSHSG